MGIPLNTDFIQLKNGKYIEVTDQHLLGLPDDDWEKYKEDFRRRMDNKILSFLMNEKV